MYYISIAKGGDTKSTKRRSPALQETGLPLSLITVSFAAMRESCGEMVERRHPSMTYFVNFSRDSSLSSCAKRTMSFHSSQYASDK